VLHRIAPDRPHIAAGEAFIPSMEFFVDENELGHKRSLQMTKCGGYRAALAFEAPRQVANRGSAIKEKPPPELDGA